VNVDRGGIEIIDEGEQEVAVYAIDVERGIPSNFARM
jgi:hypothetical protein